MMNRLLKFGLPAAIVAVLILMWILVRASSNSHIINTTSFQENFTAQETELDQFTQAAATQFSQGGLPEMIRYHSTQQHFFLHIFRNDSLIFWNTNEVPVYQLADLHFPVHGLVHLQNGWYFTRMIHKGNLAIVGSFCVQYTYPYENDQLKNDFNPVLTKKTALIIPEKRAGSSIYAKNGSFLFSLEHEHTTESNSGELTWLFLSLLTLILLCWFQLGQLFPSRRSSLLLAGGFLLLRYLALLGNWLKPFSGSELFDPTILALSEWTPNLGELLLSCLVILFLMQALMRYLKVSENKWLIFSGFLLLPALLVWLCLVAQRIVENSSIPLQLDQFFLLTRYSLVIIALIGLSGLALIVLVQTLTSAFLRIGWSVKGLLIFWLLLSGICLSVALLTGENLIVWLCPAMLTGAVMLTTVRNPGEWTFSSVLGILLLFAVISAYSIRSYASRKEMEERELYANQLAYDKDVNTELEFVAAHEQLKTDPYLQRLTSKVDKPTFTELKEALERRIFNGFWERYDMDFFFFGKQDTVIKLNGRTKGDLESLIHRHGIASEVDSTLFFVKDYTSQYSYVFRETIVSDSGLVSLYGTLKSKRIPEEIGFPRLLISDRAQVFNSLEHYSIAKYYNDKLITRYGDYSFPYAASTLPEFAGQSGIFFNRDGFSHFLLRRTDQDLIVLSRQNTDWLDWITTVAFLFVCFGLLLAFATLLYRGERRLGFRRLSLAARIQMVLVGLVVLSLLGFSLGSGTFVGSQYREYTHDAVSKKIRSVGTVASLRLGDVNRLQTASKDGMLDYHLGNWSRIFVTDVNMYDLHGNLIGSSRPKIYNIGLLSEQINPMARKALMLDKKSEYIHQERIGNLAYLSAYTPFFNDDGTLIAYLNLQHFDQQNEFEGQIQRYLAAIVNVFMVLLALSIVGAVFISNWLTSPLRMIQRNFSAVELGKHNQAIAYTSQDEVGDLVRAYNQKLAELEQTVLQLAQSERESAWREMAKQVAHEIKNPLTPMKLSVQQLQRVFDPNDPQAKQKIDRVTHSIIEQIDALASIANAFAHFARMPQPKQQKIELHAFLESLVAVYESEEACEVRLETNENKIVISADRELLLRVMNNLVTNSIQAIPSERKGLVRIIVSATEQEVVIQIIDNGAGIPEDKLATVFEPYFTTKSNGTGLGLAMVRQIIEGHQGTVEVAETSSEGTEIVIRLPLETEPFSQEK